MKDSSKRIDTFKEAAQKMGVQVVGVWVTMGEYDLVVVTDAPDDQTVATLLLSTASLGNVATQTMRAFSEDEFREIVARLA